jgi:uracil phosphoribosyltransferase
MKTVFDEMALRTKAQQANFPNVTLADHPLVRQALGAMRDQKTSIIAFRSAVAALTPHLIYAATRGLAEKRHRITTPLAPMYASTLRDQIILVPILRSGLGMLGPAQAIFPAAVTICAGVKRDEATAMPHWYRDLEQLPGLDGGKNCTFLILDPMLATAGSSIEVITRIKTYYPAAEVHMIAMIAAPEGVRKFTKSHPDVPITLAAIDDHLNEKAYIVPGLGDAGDRQFGTV